MKLAELRKLSKSEMKEQLRSLRGDFLVARCNHATGQLKNTASLTTFRKTIARLETLVREGDINE